MLITAAVGQREAGKTIIVGGERFKIASVRGTTVTLRPWTRRDSLASFVATLGRGVRGLWFGAIDAWPHRDDE
jgi:hypothetical protein